MSFSAEQLAQIQSGSSAPQAPSQKEVEAEEQRRQLLAAILDSDARERLHRIALVKPEKARSLENTIIHLCQTNKHVGTFPDSKLVQLIEQIDQKAAPKINIKRRPVFEEDSLGSLDDF
ncbi:hypothetical protein RCL1_008299 [Eukaryota sp. TZLM3-RCL]